MLFSHDANTMTYHAYQRILKGQPMPGLCVAPRDLSIGDVIDDVLIIATLSNEGEYEGRVIYLPLR